MTDSKPAKVYSFGSISRNNEIADMFRAYNAKNPMEYRFGDPSVIYFINAQNEIATASPDTDLYYVIKESQDWKLLDIKKSKKIRKFLITLKEGASTCNGCEFSGKCTQDYKDKCSLAKSLQQVAKSTELTGKGLIIEDISDLTPIPSNGIY